MKLTNKERELTTIEQVEQNRWTMQKNKRLIINKKIEKLMYKKARILDEIQKLNWERLTLSRHYRSVHTEWINLKNELESKIMWLSNELTDPSPEFHHYELFFENINEDDVKLWFGLYSVWLRTWRNSIGIPQISKFMHLSSLFSNEYISTNKEPNWLIELNHMSEIGAYNIVTSLGLSTDHRLYRGIGVYEEALKWIESNDNKDIKEWWSNAVTKEFKERENQVVYTDDEMFLEIFKRVSNLKESK